MFWTVCQTAFSKFFIFSFHNLFLISFFLNIFYLFRLYRIGLYSWEKYSLYFLFGKRILEFGVLYYKLAIS